MMFVCIGIQVLSISGIWLLLWRRNASRIPSVGLDCVSEGHELGLQDVTDLRNPHFKVSGNFFC